jgi:hypothetical protein
MQQTQWQTFVICMWESFPGIHYAHITNEKEMKGNRTNNESIVTQLVIVTQQCLTRKFFYSLSYFTQTVLQVEQMYTNTITHSLYVTFKMLLNPTIRVFFSIQQTFHFKILLKLRKFWRAINLENNSCCSENLQTKLDKETNCVFDWET